MSNFDDDIDALLASPQQVRLGVCKVKYILQTVTPVQSEKIQKLVDAGVIAGPQLARILQKHGFEITDKAINRHRRRLTGGGCSCP